VVFTVFELSAFSTVSTVTSVVVSVSVQLFFHTGEVSTKHTLCFGGLFSVVSVVPAVGSVTTTVEPPAAKFVVHVSAPVAVVFTHVSTSLFTFVFVVVTVPALGSVFTVVVEESESFVVTHTF
jgi:hypothetical protein